MIAEFIGMSFFVFTGCGTAIFFSSTRVSTFATETEANGLQVAQGANGTIADAAAKVAPNVDLNGVADIVKKGFVDSVRVCVCCGARQHAQSTTGVRHGRPAAAPPLHACEAALPPLAASPFPPPCQAAILTVNSSWGVLTAMAFGCSIMVLAYGIGALRPCLYTVPCAPATPCMPASGWPPGLCPSNTPAC